ncbi:outer membrane beta-barrel protein [Vibrio marisflavi]|uniref:Outer membrane protein A n=1 Tax=Vibrio marisflavi CECT 7928 TaxID=634439 RepID=A0ABM8ZZI6_9VIBR|nr:outer membrane beta-barrel protein [Vibrio marisflavi]CAH0536520.1 Outer membrane protein A [Vibrio marisflavi CECT 7928]
MKLRSLKNVIALTALLASTGAFAGNFYAEGGAGGNIQQVGGGGEDTGLFEGAASARLAGGYEQAIDDNWKFGGELGYNYFGNAEYLGGIVLKSSAIDLSGVGSYQITNKLSVFAKGGVAYMMLKAQGINGFEIIGNNTAHDVSPLVGLGINYAVTDTFSLGTSATYYWGAPTGDSADHAAPAVANFLVNARYTFK